MRASSQCLTPKYVSAYYYICVLIPLYMCPHTTIYARLLTVPDTVINQFATGEFYYAVCLRH